MRTTFTRSPAGTTAIRRRAAATLCTALLTGTVLATGAVAARAEAPPSFAVQVLGGFTLKRVETTSGKTSVALLVCTSAARGGKPAKIHGAGNLKDATAACEELNAVHGDFAALDVHPTWLVPALAAPVHVEAHGTWQKVKVAYSHDFQNDGELAKQTGDVFTF